MRFSSLPATYEALERLAYMHAVERHGSSACEPSLNGVLATVGHEFTNYDEILARLAGRFGKGDAYEVLRQDLDDQVRDHVREAYPERFPDDG